MSILTVHNLTKTFAPSMFSFTKRAPYTAVKGISFHLGKGEILGLLGTNGAGKTTTIQMLLGTLTPTNGTISYFGKDFAHNRTLVLNKIGYASGYEKLPARLTVQDNLDVIGRIYGIPEPRRSQQIERLLNFFGIRHLRDQSTGGLSAGQATRVMLCKAFIADPEIVLLDEPTASLDPEVAYEVRRFILAQSEERNTSILITSHNMAEVTELCDRVLVLKGGVIVANDSPESLARSISNIRVHLSIMQGLDRVEQYLREKQWMYVIEDNHITIQLEEHLIAQCLADMSERKIIYSHIAIDRPTLEEYFIRIAKGIL